MTYTIVDRPKWTPDPAVDPITNLSGAIRAWLNHNTTLILTHDQKHQLAAYLFGEFVEPLIRAATAAGTPQLGPDRWRAGDAEPDHRVQAVRGSHSHRIYFRECHPGADRWVHKQSGAWSHWRHLVQSEGTVHCLTLNVGLVGPNGNSHGSST